MENLLQMFWSFCKIGYTSFGGMSMIPLINAEMVSHGWMSPTEVSDIVAIAEMTPGPLGLNCATFAGMRVDGMVGAIVCVAGVLMPTLTLCVLAAIFFERFRGSTVLNRMMLGIRPVSMGIIFGVMVTLSRTNYVAGTSVNPGALAIGLVSLFLLLKKQWSVPRVILVAALLGLIL